MNTQPEIIFDVLPTHQGGIGLVMLSRPDRLNALSHAMIIALDNQLRAWEKKTEIKAVIVQAEGTRAFCAGGDIRKIYEAGKAGDFSVRKFFWDEYRLNRRIHKYTKPYIAFLDGIVMGGGVGISIHGSHRIATENTLFAMPETGIGFFPDIGGSYFLSRMPGFLGMFLGLTGARLKSNDALFAGVVNHVVASDKQEDIIQALVSSDLQQDAHAVVTDILNQFQTPATPAPLSAHRSLIDDCFSEGSVEKVIERLKDNSGDWQDDIRKILLDKSPTSLKVTLKQIHYGAKMDFDACMQMEYRIANHFLVSHDFYEGVRTVIIDKHDHPTWSPARLADVTDDEIDKYFNITEEELSFNDV